MGANHGKAHCEGSKCICDSGYCTYDGVHCVSECNPNRTVGQCLGVGCFAAHGSAHCSGVSCKCDPGYCSSDGWHCLADQSCMQLDLNHIIKAGTFQYALALCVASECSRYVGKGHEYKCCGLRCTAKKLSETIPSCWAVAKAKWIQKQKKEQCADIDVLPSSTEWQQTRFPFGLALGAVAAGIVIVGFSLRDFRASRKRTHQPHLLA